MEEINYKKILDGLELDRDYRKILKKIEDKITSLVLKLYGKDGVCEDIVNHYTKLTYHYDFNDIPKEQIEDVLELMDSIAEYNKFEIILGIANLSNHRECLEYVLNKGSEIYQPGFDLQNYVYYIYLSTTKMNQHKYLSEVYRKKIHYVNWLYSIGKEDEVIKNFKIADYEINIEKNNKLVETSEIYVKINYDHLISKYNEICASNLNITDETFEKIVESLINNNKRALK